MPFFLIFNFTLLLFFPDGGAFFVPQNHLIFQFFKFTNKIHSVY